MNARASRMRWGAIVALAVAAPIAVLSYRHAHASTMSSPAVSSTVDGVARAEESQLFATHHVRSLAQVAPSAASCQFGQDRTCNEDASVSTLRGSCRHDGSCACVSGAEKTKDGRCR